MGEYNFTAVDTLQFGIGAQKPPPQLFASRDFMVAVHVLTYRVMGANMDPTQVDRMPPYDAADATIDHSLPEVRIRHAWNNVRKIGTQVLTNSPSS